MAIVIESVSTAAYTTGIPLGISKPTGLAVGELMVAHLAQAIGGSTNCDDWDTPSGWTSLITTANSVNSNSSAGIHVFYKIADSGDVATSEFFFTPEVTAGGLAGAIYRISGANTTGISAVSGTASNTTSPIFSNSVTPSDANSLLLFLLSNSDAGNTVGSVTGYSIGTDNPTWTEQYDIVGDLSGDDRGIMSGASAIRSQATATGNSTCAITNFSQNSCGVMVVIPRLVSAPTLATSAVSSIDLTTATGNGEVSSSGEATITERGFVWNTSTAPTILNLKSTVAGTTGVFSGPITGLSINTLYYLRAYATNSVGTSYGNEVTFTTLPAEDNQIIKDIDGVEGETYAISVNVGGSAGTVTVKLGTTGTSQVINAGAGVTVVQGTYSGLSGLIFEASATFNGYIDDVMWVLVLGDATIDWDLDSLTNVYPINSSVVFKRVEDKEFDRFRIYRYLDIQFKDLNAYVTVLLKKEANEDLTNSTKPFLVSNVSGETLPFINKRVSTLLKGQAMRVGLSNNNLSETFSVCQFVLKGVEQPRKLFDKSKIISVQ